MDFKRLITNTENAHSVFYNQSVKAVNVNLTLRNWVVGWYIVEFEQNGEDRAEYGKRLLIRIAEEIRIRGLGETNLKLCRQFFQVYPEFLETLSKEFKKSLPQQIRQLLTDELYYTKNQALEIRQSATDEFRKNSSHLISILQNTSFIHFVELIQLDDIVKRRFYELLILKTTPSVKELKRQIETLTYERLGLSGDIEITFEQLAAKIEPLQSSDLVKSHYFFDFLELRQPQLLEESELEQALINHLHHFILELGNGFCFEARQKRILIGDEYYHVDLVFYHRVLKYHVLIDLKTEYAKHENIGQLKAYIEHFKRKIMLPSDNPPVGILLVTEQNKTLVEYAIADSDKEIFVSQHLLQLPSKEILQQFFENELSSF